MPKQLTLIAILLFTTSCAGWQTTSRKVLRTAGEAAYQIAGASDNACRQILEVCKAQKKNPCPPLLRCLAYREQIYRIGAGIQITVATGYMAVDAADKGKVDKSIKEAQRLLGLCRKLLEALK